MGDRIEASWLDLRRDADARAREASLPLIQTLANSLTLDVAGRHWLSVLDLGAGTGANAQWLAPRFDQALSARGFPRLSQHWKLLDHDQALLDARRVDLAHSRHRVSEHAGTVADVAGLLKESRGDAAGVILTCSALLDLLTRCDIEVLVASAVAGADAALLAMSVTGEIQIDPSDADDDVVTRLFNAHQQGHCAGSLTAGEAAAGPDGWKHAAAAFTASGWSVQVAQTPWQLGPSSAALTARLLTERAEAAATVAPDSATARRVRRWLVERLRRHEEASGLEVRVAHVDLLALPPRSISVQMSSPSE